ncbi:MAG: PHP domain-containing protein [Eubacteriales bacterium]|nr:PHP domain-containing protein [Eubacteriales bacterium]
MYRIETHLHTSLVSKCGHLTPQELAEAYARAGYSAIAVTDHFNRTTFHYLDVGLTDGAEAVRRFLEGFEQLRLACRPYGIQVYKGAELRFDECENDYLLYGFHDELLRDPEAVFRMGVAAFSPLAREDGALLVQAHPYRRKCTPAIAFYLDGVEVFNGNPRHESHNDQAEAYARMFGLLRLAGSDCHQTPDIAASGILTQDLPGDSFAFANLLRAGRYTLMSDQPEK